MEKDELVNKVKHLLLKAKMSWHLNRFGPNKYELFECVFFFFVRVKFRLGCCWCAGPLKGLGFKCASKSALAYQANKILSKLRVVLLKIIRSTGLVELGSIDSRGF